MFGFDNDKQLKEKYLNKSISVGSSRISVVYEVHKVWRGWLYCYYGDEEVRFKPDDVKLN